MSRAENALANLDLVIEKVPEEDRENFLLGRIAFIGRLERELAAWAARDPDEDEEGDVDPPTQHSAFDLAIIDSGLRERLSKLRETA